MLKQARDEIRQAVAAQRADFRARLRELRTARGFSQALFARAVGVGHIAVNRHETGVAYPSAEVMRDYAKALGVSVCHLEHGTGDGLPVPELVLAYLDSPEGLALPPDLRERLRVVPWSLLAPTPTLREVRRLAEILQAPSG